ncbi:FtsX-like permease family protein [Porphyromonas pogonae]|uniref:FtsX-like permease family protein n=1 Tax=Porphyromonas pogonae TaxID=867595 RepID=UPI00300F1B68
MFFGKRYLFSKKRLNAVNIVSVISAAAIGVVCTALVCILSIFNGYEDLILSQTGDLDPDLMIVPAHGEVLYLNNKDIRSALNNTDVDSYTAIIKQQGLIKSGDNQTPATIYGVDSQYRHVTHVDNLVVSGKFSLSVGDHYGYNAGTLLCLNLRIGAGFADPVSLYFPNRLGVINPLVPSSAFKMGEGYIASSISCKQEAYDKSLFVPIAQMRLLLGYDDNVATHIGVKAKHPSQVAALRSALIHALGSDYLVQDKQAQYPSIGRLVAMEKWMTYLILIFVLLLAAFNVVSSISMLILEKQHDATILRSMGAMPRLLQRIFMTEGMLITLCGAVIGIALGLVLCFIQLRYGVIKIQSGISTFQYPIKIVLSDIILIALTIVTLSYLIAWYPVYYFKSKWR